MKLECFETIEQNRTIIWKIDEILTILEERWIQIREFLLELSDIPKEVDTSDEYNDKLNALELKYWFEKNEYINIYRPMLRLFQTTASLSTILWKVDLAQKTNNTN